MKKRRTAPVPRKLYDYPRSSTGKYVLSRDGKEILTGTEDDIWSYMHRHHSYSVDHALRYEGYRIVPASASSPLRAITRPLKRLARGFVRIVRDRKAP